MHLLPCPRLSPVTCLNHHVSAQLPGFGFWVLKHTKQIPAYSPFARRVLSMEWSSPGCLYVRILPDAQVSVYISPSKRDSLDPTEWSHWSDSITLFWFIFFIILVTYYLFDFGQVVFLRLISSIFTKGKVIFPIVVFRIKGVHMRQYT